MSNNCLQYQLKNL